MRRNENEIWGNYKSLLWIVFMLLTSISFVAAFWMYTFHIVDWFAPTAWAIIFLFGINIAKPKPVGILTPGDSPADPTDH